MILGLSFIDWSRAGREIIHSCANLLVIAIYESGGSADMNIFCDKLLAKPHFTSCSSIVISLST